MKEESTDVYGHVLKYTSIFGGVQGLNILISLVRNKIVALLLGTSGMGLSSLFTTTVNFVSQATNLGVSFSAVRHLSELFDANDEERAAHFVKVIRAWSLLTGLFGMLVCIAIGPALSDYTFSWGNHTLHFILLSPAVAMMAITGGETAILKGARRLQALAWIQVAAVFAALLISIPIYYVFGESGIVPVIVFMGLATLLLTVRHSYRLYPLRLRGARGLLGEGMDMVRLGVAFTLAGIVGSASEMLIRSYLNVESGLDDVGLYNVGFMITITYAGMVFSAMETDYFPRLSAVNNDVEATNRTVNNQTEVSLLMLSPMLVGLLMFLPVLIPLMTSAAFLPVVDMAQVAVLAMYLKVLTLPVAYITLARGHSLSYLLLESSYYVVFVIFVILGHRMWGLYGTGVAIVAAHAFDFLMINGYAYWKFGFRSTSAVARYASVQLALGVAAYAVACLMEGWAYWMTEAALTMVSTAYSVSILRRKTRLWESLLRRLRGA